MKRRLGFALVGMVIAALLLAGVGTIVLASVGSRQAAEDSLVEQTKALNDLFTELTIPTGPAGSGTVRDRLRRVSRSISVKGIGLLLLPPNAEKPLGTLPDGVTISDLDLEALVRGKSMSGSDRHLIWAAAGGVNPQGIPQVLVLTRAPDPILVPATKWFVLAAAGTIVVSLLVTIRLSRSLTDPVREASEAATRIAEGDLATRIPDDHKRIGGEIAELVDSINAMAANLERSRSLERQFLLSVSHDLRTPLTSIRGYAEALTDGAVSDAAAVGTVIEGESRRLERLVGDLLLLARLESTGFTYDTSRHDASEIVADTAHGFDRQAEERGIDLSVRVPDDEMAVVVDPDRYAQIVSNLVGNACRFAGRTVAVTLWAQEGRIHLAVGDDGPGIADDDLDHVFERLYVAQQNPKVKESGSGLGLAIVRELVHGMGGTVVARRSALGGAEFVVSFAAAR